jgi:hypothetical protein
MPKRKNSSDGGWKPFPQLREKVPIVFMFKPTYYKMVSTNKELEQWEQCMIEQVGFSKNSPLFQRDAQGKLMIVGGTSISACGLDPMGNQVADD